MRVIAEGRPVIVGEVLFDTLPSGEAMLGGAPFNVAWHLKGFGLDPLFISKVGEDCNGEQSCHWQG
jgi:fructokinase